MHAPQIIIIVMLAIGFTVSLYEHGKPKTGEYNAFWFIFSASLYQTLLIWGGFYSH